MNGIQEYRLTDKSLPTVHYLKPGHSPEAFYTLELHSNPTAMTFPVTALLICMLLPEVSSLMCQQCINLGVTPCKSTQINCSDQCATVSIYTGVTQVNMQTCSTPGMCFNGSVNTGAVNWINNAKCCNTDFCNNETVLAMPHQPPNGRMCFTCDHRGCFKTLKCLGDQNFCISESIQQGSNIVFIKGCASKSICAMAPSSSQGIGMMNVRCCEGNLCNAAESFTQTFLLMLVHLFVTLPTSTVFY